MILKCAICINEVSYDKWLSQTYLFHRRPRDDLKRRPKTVYVCLICTILWIYNNKLLSQRKSDFNAKLIWPGSSEGLRKGF